MDATRTAQEQARAQGQEGFAYVAPEQSVAQAVVTQASAPPERSRKSLGNLAGMTKVLSVTILGIPIELVYYPRRVAMANDGDEQPEGEEAAPPMARLMASLLCRWDLEGPLPFEPGMGAPIGAVVPEGTVIPITPKNLTYIDVEILYLIRDAIQDDCVPKPPTPTR